MMEAQELPVIFAAAALAIAAYSSSVSVGLFTKIFAVNGKRKRQLESFFFFFLHCLQPLYFLQSHRSSRWKRHIKS